ncbi:MAG TPA: AAA family ATPase, partial [Bacteroidia bacterium]
TGSTSTKQEETLEDVLKKLDELIGMEEIKKNIREHINYLNFEKIRKEKGLSDPGGIKLHAIFTGNPGTGKTTVVRLLGKIYQKMGLLTKGHVKEVDRSDLVAQYIGQTAPKVKKVIDEARGGILFIDEAYSLTRAKDDSNDFGHEVIEIILKEMSDGKGNIAIMCAGYPKQMQDFIDSNPGLKSRFGHYFHFQDYMPEELIQIAEFAATKNNITLTPEAKTVLSENIIEAYRKRDEAFGNARFAHSVITEAKMNMGQRLMKSANVNELSNEQLSTVEAEDVQKVFAGHGKKKLSLSVNDKLLKEGMDELNQLTGMNNIKEDVNELVKLVKFYQETGRDVLGKFSLHSVFTGNPGTGKTTVARIIAKIYKGLGLLERGHIVEVDREGLVAGYVGQTATKTAARIDEAMGGILFIDEAYALANVSTSHDFGQEAIQVILKRMEDHRGEFGVIVAGYPDNMHEFIESNPGFRSRFDRTFQFFDYSPEEMYIIALSILAKEKMRPDAQAEEHLKKYFAFLYASRDKHFGNARSVRQVIGESIKNQNLRLASMTAAQRTKEMLETLTFDDVKEFEVKETRSAGGTLGFKYGVSA